MKLFIKAVFLPGVLLFCSCSKTEKNPYGGSALTGDLTEKLNYISDKSNYNTEHDRLHDLFQVYYDWQMEQSPISATFNGVSDYDSLWDDISPEGVYEVKEGYRLFANTIDWFDSKTLSEDDLLNITIYKSEIEGNFNLFVQFPEEYLQLDQIQGLHFLTPQVFQAMPKKTATDFDNIIRRLERMPGFFIGLEQTLKQGVKKNVVMPKTSVKGVPDQLRTLINNDVEASIYYTPFIEEKNNIDESQFEAYRLKAQEIIKQKVNPALEEFLDFVENTYLPACRESVGLSELESGKLWYSQRIKFHTTTNLTAKEIHDLGISEVARIKKEMQLVIEEIGFKEDMHKFNIFLRTDPQFFYKTPEELITAYRDICKRIDPELVKQFGHLPRNTYGVRAVPSYAEKTTTTAYYQPGSYEAGLPGYFMANTYDLKSRPKWEMEALSIHEAVPGHHLQISIQQELDNIPGFREVAFFTSYVEGWALYAESLGYEMGMYQDPYSRYGQLVYEMWRVIRLVLDTGIHAFGWTREEAITYFMENSGKSEQDITVEVDRYIAWPGQALAYKIGQLKISELRAKAEKELGENFDVRSFHDELLAYGSLPLDVLEEIIDNWIEDQLSTRKV